MECEQVFNLLSQILAAKTQVQLPAYKPLIERGLVGVFDFYYRKLSLIKISDPSELKRILQKLEKNLRSDLHRTTTSATTLLEEEKMRAQLLSLMGAFQHHVERIPLKNILENHAGLVPPGADCSDFPIRLFLTERGKRTGQHLQEKGRSFSGKSIDDFLKYFSL